MAKIEFRKAYFTGFSFTVGPARGEGAPMVVATFRAPWTDKHRESVGWKEVPDTVSGNVKLKPATIAGTHLEFIPQSGMEKHRIALDVSSVENCHVFVPKDEDGERELRFTIKTPVKNAERELGDLGRTVGSATGILKLSYDADAQRSLLEDDPEGQESLEESEE